MKLTVNGTQHEVDVPADKPLLWVLREDLNITGPNFLRGVSPMLNATDPCGDNQSLAEWMRMPRCPCTRFEGNDATTYPCRCTRLKA